MNNEFEETSVARAGGRGVLLFEQQERESNKAFAAFKTYLELGPERSLVLVTETAIITLVLMADGAACLSCAVMFPTDCRQDHLLFYRWE